MSDSQIAICIPSLRTGGVQRMMITVANGLSKEGHTVQLVVGNTHGRFGSIVSDSVNIVDLKAWKPPMASTTGLFSPIYKYFLKNDPAVFISSMNHINIVILFAWKLSRTNTDMIVVEHNNPHALQQNSIKNSLVYKIASVEYKWADHIIGVSNGVVDSLREDIGLTNCELTRIYNPVVSPDIQEKSSEIPDHPWILSESPVIVNIGRLVQQKDHELLLRSFANLRSDIQARLIIIGRGKRKERLIRLSKRLGIDEYLDIIDWVENPYAYLGNADVFALSSRWEGLPTVLIEALACGCPIVSMDCPSGPREITMGDKYGTLVKDRDPNKLAEAIRQKLLDPEPKEKLFEGADRFTEDQCVEQYDELVRKFI